MTDTTRCEPPDERERVAKFLMERAPEVGAGDDPVGFLMASYAYVIQQRNEQSAVVAALVEALEVIGAGVVTFHINPVGGGNITVDGSTRFAHERDIEPAIAAARAALAAYRSQA